jgi:DNA-binding NarL/FixJ family response regulator
MRNQFNSRAGSNLSPLSYRLTSREREILRLVAEGDTDQTIAQKLNIGHRTIRTHLENICQKLQARNRTNAVYLSMKRNLI